MTSLKILKKWLSEQELEQLLELLVEAGIVQDDVEVVDSVRDPDPACEDEVLLLLATDATCEAPDLEKEMVRAQNGPRRTIVVWPAQSSETAWPPTAKKYAYSIVPSDPAKLSEVLADDDVTRFEDSSGQPLPKIEMEHNLCVEEEKKSK